MKNTTKNTTKNTIKNTCLLTTAILCAALLGACGNILSPGSSGGGTGTIAISFAPAGTALINSASSRIAVPDSDLVYMTHEITLTGPGGQTIHRTISGTGGTANVEVAPGVWHISILTRGPLPGFYDGAMVREFGESHVAVATGQQARAGIHMDPALGVETPDQLENAIGAIGELGAAAAIVVMADIAAPPLALTGGNVTLRGLDGQRRISLSGNGSLFTAEGGAALTLSGNITLEGHGANDSPLVWVESGGRLYMNAGALITGNSNSANSAATTGGGVRNEGTFVMRGGTISGNSTIGSGGGVNVQGDFTMTGGNITDNAAGEQGGGVFVALTGTFNDNAPAGIFGNTAADNPATNDRGLVTELPLAGTVSISGSAVVGQTLTANTAALGGIGALSFQWMQNGNPIFGETGTTYVVQAADVGMTITVTVTRAGYTGSVTSVPTAAVIQPALDGTVTITGSAVVGQTLTAVPGGALASAPGLSFQWMRGGIEIVGATGSMYVVQSADVGATITVVVSRAGYTGSVTSAATAAVIQPALDGTVTITGSAVVGQTLTANIANLDGSGAPGFQWMRNGNPIASATGTTYVVQADDLGMIITVTVTRAGYTGSVTSAATAAVILPTIAGTVAIGGAANALLNQTLTASPGGALASAPGLSFQWMRNGNPIDGATGDTFVPTEAELGSYITVRVTREGFTGSVVSPAPGRRVTWTARITVTGITLRDPARPGSHLLLERDSAPYARADAASITASTAFTVTGIITPPGQFTVTLNLMTDGPPGPLGTPTVATESYYGTFDVPLTTDIISIPFADLVRR